MPPKFDGIILWPIHKPNVQMELFREAHSLFESRTRSVIVPSWAPGTLFAIIFEAALYVSSAFAITADPDERLCFKHLW